MIGKSLKLQVLFIVILLSAGLLLSGIIHAADKKDMGGWEKDGAYNKLYKVADMDNIKVIVKDIKEVTPMPGMSPGIALVVDDRDGEEIIVHLGPKWFLRTVDIRKGSKIKIRGAWAELDDQDIFMASKVKQGDKTLLKVRLTSDGTPFWTMSAEQLAKEQQGLD